MNCIPYFLLSAARYNLLSCAQQTINDGTGCICIKISHSVFCLLVSDVLFYFGGQKMPALYLPVAICVQLLAYA